MSAHRLFLTAPLASATSRTRAELAPQDLHHAVNVLRVRAGEELELVEPGERRAWRVRIARVSAHAIEVEALERLSRVYHPAITLVQGVAKGEKMDAIVRQAVEIGAERIVPMLSERSVVRLDAAKRVARGERWRRLAKAAAEQAHQDRVPRVDDPAPLADIVPVLQEHDGVVVLWEEASGTGLAAATAAWVRSPDARIALVIGPEGGLASSEVAALEGIGAVPVTLGRGILRTETAAIVALSLLSHAMGGLGACDG
jgi:16S rRNA (uracil1498-N3)-methyltransferase